MELRECAAKARIHSERNKFRGEDIKRGRRKKKGSCFTHFAGCWLSLAEFRVGRNLENFRD